MEVVMMRLGWFTCHVPKIKGISVERTALRNKQKNLPSQATMYLLPTGLFFPTIGVDIAKFLANLLV